ncbi:amino acid adenylation domain-containing protein, partial [Lentibacillus sp. N15]|uniref:non-ribosomal peptide synthetase n=1 Tax=Lentibacillus songyuanensis TaxID=3136161 RepID=UPI0031BBC0A0
EMPYPKEKTIHCLFEEQVEKDPNQVAVVFKETQLTYKELNEHANCLARILREQGVKPEDRVGLLMERSLDMIVGMLGILKAGGAYLPIDPAYPAERIDYMLEDSSSRIVLSQTEVIDQLWPEVRWAGKCLDVKKMNFEGIDKSNLRIVNHVRNLGYVMYTSGTTGHPKGVEVIHRNVVRLVRSTNYATLNENEVLLQLASIAFDAATFEIWGSLLNGARLVMIGSNRPTLEEIAYALKHEKVTTLFLTTALFNTIVDHQLMSLDGVQQLLMGGETVSVPHVRKALSLSNLQLVHVYGPTENTTFSSYYVVPDTWKNESTIPIGKPINNTKIYLLDERGQVVPIGVAGEIYLAGEGLARGYLNRPELTGEKFVPNPFSPGEKMYRTGDLARYLPDGNIEFLGRIDQQVKIRGYRIELGEIENTLLGHPNVKDATVLDWKEGENETFLCA